MYRQTLTTASGPRSPALLRVLAQVPPLRELPTVSWNSQLHRAFYSPPPPPPPPPTPSPGTLRPPVPVTHSQSRSDKIKWKTPEMHSSQVLKRRPLSSDAAIPAPTHRGASPPSSPVLLRVRPNEMSWERPPSRSCWDSTLLQWSYFGSYWCSYLTVPGYKLHSIIGTNGEGKHTVRRHLWFRGRTGGLSWNVSPSDQGGRLPFLFGFVTALCPPGFLCPGSTRAFLSLTEPGTVGSLLPAPRSAGSFSGRDRGHLAVCL